MHTFLIHLKCVIAILTISSSCKGIQFLTTEASKKYIKWNSWFWCTALFLSLPLSLPFSLLLSLFLSTAETFVSHASSRRMALSLSFTTISDPYFCMGSPRCIYVKIRVQWRDPSLRGFQGVAGHSWLRCARMGRRVFSNSFSSKKILQATHRAIQRTWCMALSLFLTSIWQVPDHSENAISGTWQRSLPGSISFHVPEVALIILIATLFWHRITETLLTTSLMNNKIFLVAKSLWMMFDEWRYLMASAIWTEKSTNKVTGNDAFKASCLMFSASDLRGANSVTWGAKHIKIIN